MYHKCIVITAVRCAGGAATPTRRGDGKTEGFAGMEATTTD